MEKRNRRKSLASILIAFAALLIIIGSMRNFRVYESVEALPSDSPSGPSIPSLPMDTDSDPIPSLPGDVETVEMPSLPLDLDSPWTDVEEYKTISEYNLVYEATVSGVVRKDGKMYFSTPPDQRGGKRACPT